MPSSAWRSTLFPYTTLFRSDRKSTRLNSSHDQISYAVFCLKKKTERSRDVGGPARLGRRLGDEDLGDPLAAPRRLRPAHERPVGVVLERTEGMPQSEPAHS